MSSGSWLRSYSLCVGIWILIVRWFNSMEHLNYACHPIGILYQIELLRPAISHRMGRAPWWGRCRRHVDLEHDAVRTIRWLRHLHPTHSAHSGPACWPRYASLTPYLPLPMLTGSHAHCAKLDGVFGLVARPLTIAYHRAHALWVGFWSGGAGPYQSLPYITMPAF